MEWLVAVCVGISLAAATGFRVFLPLLALSLASRLENSPVHLAPEWAWLGSNAATLALGAATLVEVGAYFIPWVDHALDVVAAPAAVVAGTLVAAVSVSDLPPLLQWTVAVVGGGGTAAIVKGGAVLTRALSGISTGGLGNPVLAAAEVVSSTILSILAFLVPLLVGFFVAVLGVGLAAWWISRRSRRSRTEPYVLPSEPLLRK